MTDFKNNNEIIPELNPTLTPGTEERAKAVKEYQELIEQERELAYQLACVKDRQAQLDVLLYGPIQSNNDAYIHNEMDTKINR